VIAAGRAGTKAGGARRCPMIRTALAIVCAAALAMPLAGCDRPEPVPQPQVAANAPSPSATPTAEIRAPGVPPTSRDPAEVLAMWAKAVETRDWVTVRAFWGDHGARSGLSDKDFAARWSSLRDPKVTIGKGAQEGAAGSSYYTAPVRIVDGARVVTGEVVLRRVNDVDGATDEQLRWHIESTTLVP